MAYVQTFVRSKGKFVRSKTDNLCVHVQTIVRSKNFMSRLSCGQNWLCPDFRAFSKGNFVRSKFDNLCVHVQTILRSKLPMSRLSCAPKLIICAFMSRLSCDQKDICHQKMPMSRLLCVPYQKPSAAKLIFCAFLSRLSCFQKTLCRHFSAFKMAYVQTFECSKPKFAHQNLQLS